MLGTGAGGGREDADVDGLVVLPAVSLEADEVALLPDAERVLEVEGAAEADADARLEDVMRDFAFPPSPRLEVRDDALEMAAETPEGLDLEGGLDSSLTRRAFSFALLLVGRARRFSIRTVNAL